MIRRARQRSELRRLLGRRPVVGLLGMRQVGKTTLARQVARERAGGVTWFDLEDPRDLARLADPMLALERLRGLVVLDEVQRAPDLFPVLRVLADRPRSPARFLVLGSASPDLLRQSSESLAGRIHYHRLRGVCPDEVGWRHARRLWLRGGLPRAYLARTAGESLDWRLQLIETVLQRDIPQLGVSADAGVLRRFWTMLAHYHGQTWNGAELARSLGVSLPTVTRYLGLLESTWLVRRLPPWHENLKKRQVRSPKVYVDDSGLLHALLNLPTLRDLEGHPKVGASWESFAMAAVVERLGARPDECYFWATHQGAELDLLVVRGRRRLGFEFKRTTAPAVTKSMRIALRDVGPSSITVIHAGQGSFDLDTRVRAVALDEVDREIRPLP